MGKVWQDMKRICKIAKHSKFVMNYLREGKVYLLKYKEWSRGM